MYRNSISIAYRFTAQRNEAVLGTVLHLQKCYTMNNTNLFYSTQRCLIEKVLLHTN